MAITALQITDRIFAQLEGADTGSDRIVAGDPLNEVTGIATTAMATLDCLRQAADADLNLIISCEPTFWSTDDRLDRLETDPLFLQKRDFIREHRMTVLSFRDQWQEGIATGMARTLGWENDSEGGEGSGRFVLPQTTLLELGRYISRTLQDRTMRIVGNPALQVERVAAIWGTAEQLHTIDLLNGPADVVICGYTREWESVEYVQDMISTGSNKGLIMLGQVKSVEGGMRYCAEWLRTAITEVPVDFIPVPEPYWGLPVTAQ